MSYWTQWGFQDATSPLIEEFAQFNDFAIIIVIFILLITFRVIVSLRLNSIICSSLVEGQVIECLWTAIPALVLVHLAVPSLILLYILDESLTSRLSVKVIAHQWFWRYEYSDLWRSAPSVEFESYITKNEIIGEIRLLDADNRLTLPYGYRISALIRSADVLHSWAVPVLGVKVDAIPGRLNQAVFVRFRPGVFFGQCSEICGANHRFIPIALEFVHLNDFYFWA